MPPYRRRLPSVGPLDAIVRVAQKDTNKTAAAAEPSAPYRELQPLQQRRRKVAKISWCPELICVFLSNPDRISEAGSVRERGVQFNSRGKTRNGDCVQFPIRGSTD